MAKWGVWLSGGNFGPGRWMTRGERPKEPWSGSSAEAEKYAAERRELYPHIHYTVAPFEEPSSKSSPIKPISGP